MRKLIPFSGLLCALLASAALLVAADPPAQSPEPKKGSEVKRIPVGKKNVTLVLDGDRRTVEIESVVCLREGALEQLLTRKDQKEHEAILSADIDARDVHQALLLAR